MKTAQQTFKCSQKYLDMSKDPLPPSAEEFTQTGPEERVERHERFENRSSGHVQHESSAQSQSSKNVSHTGETSSKLEESEMEKSEMPRRRIAGKRTVEDDAHVPAKKERAECTDLSLASLRVPTQNCECAGKKTSCRQSS